MPSAVKPHLGGHLGLTGLLVMLTATSCVALSEAQNETRALWLPAWAQTAQPVSQPVHPATALTETSKETTFIVRFENEPLLSDVGKSFRSDPKSAQASFKLWQKQHPDMQGIKLVRASYSGELILALPENDPLDRQAEDVLKALRAMDTLVYAEPDSLAKASQ